MAAPHGAYMLSSRSMQSLCCGIQSPRSQSEEFTPPIYRSDKHFTKLGSAGTPIGESRAHREIGRKVRSHMRARMPGRKSEPRLTREPILVSPDETKAAA
jgi:hypothetical protein